jgi:hypothetical protein
MMRTKVAQDGGSFANNNPAASIKQLILWEKPNINQAIKPSKRQQLESNFNSKHILKPSIEQVVQSFRRPGGSVLAQASVAGTKTLDSLNRNQRPV